jgi:hypothetical protein
MVASPLPARELRRRRWIALAGFLAAPVLVVELVVFDLVADGPNHWDAIVFWSAVQIGVTRWFVHERRLWRLAEDPPTVTDAVGVLWEGPWEFRYKGRGRYVALYPPDAVVGQAPILTVREPKRGRVRSRYVLLSDGPPRPDAPVVAYGGPDGGTAWQLRPRHLPPWGSRLPLFDPPTLRELRGA